MNNLTEIRVYLSPAALLERGILNLNFKLVQQTMKSTIRECFPKCDVFVEFEQNQETSHIHFLDEDGNFVQTLNKSLWAKVIIAIETTLNQLHTDNVYPHLN